MIFGYKSKGKIESLSFLLSLWKCVLRRRSANDYDRKTNRDGSISLFAEAYVGILGRGRNVLTTCLRRLLNSIEYWFVERLSIYFMHRWFVRLRESLYKMRCVTHRNSALPSCVYATRARKIQFQCSQTRFSIPAPEREYTHRTIWIAREKYKNKMRDTREIPLDLREKCIIIYFTVTSNRCIAVVAV